MSTDNGGESDRLIGQGLALSLFRTFLGSGLFGAFSRSGGGLALVDGFVGRSRLLSGRRFLGGGLLGRSLLSRSLPRGRLPRGSVLDGSFLAWRFIGGRICRSRLGQGFLRGRLRRGGRLRPGGGG